MIEKKDTDGKTPLINAALYGDIDAARTLLAQGANVKAKDNFGRTPLIAATATWNGPMDSLVDIIRLFLDYGADVNAQNTKGQTALMEVIGHRPFERQLEIIQLLLSRKPDLNLKDKTGRTALAMAGPAIAPLLKKAGAKNSFGGKCPLRRRNRDMILSEANRSLHEAIWQGNLEQVKTALDGGADPNAKNARLNTPLVSAAMEGHTVIVEALLHRGANPNQGGSDGSALQWAIIGGNVDMAHCLLRAGAGVSWRDLQNACERHVSTVAEAILDRGVDVNGSTQDGATALMSAAFVSDAMTARLLLDRGSDVTARTMTGWTALHSAAAKGHTAVVQLLLNAGADIAASDKDGDTALRLAKEAGHVETVEILRDAGARA